MKYPEAFQTWWLMYPRKVGKKAAFRAWQTAIKDIADDQDKDSESSKGWLLEITSKFADSDRGQAGEYCPHPTTWLNQGRYDDDPEEWVNKEATVNPFRTGVRPADEVRKDWRP